MIPDKASELHLLNLQRITEQALERSGRSLKEIGGIAVTVGPGLKACLWEGVKFARKLAKEAEYVHNERSWCGFHLPIDRKRKGGLATGIFATIQ